MKTPAPKLLRIRERILLSCAAARLSGWTIERKTILSEKRKACCALGSLCISNLEVLDVLTVVEKQLSLTQKQIWSFIWGFDDQGKKPDVIVAGGIKAAPEYYQLGKDIAKEVFAE